MSTVQYVMSAAGRDLDVCATDGDRDVKLGSSTTTGDVEIGQAVTAGEIRLGYTGGRTGIMRIGGSSSTGIINIHNGAQIDIQSGPHLVLRSNGATDIRALGTLRIGASATGNIEIGNNASGTGTITTGHTTYSGDITTNTSGDTVVNAGGTLKLGSTSTGNIEIGVNASGTGTITTGHTTYSGDITTNTSGDTVVNAGGTLKLGATSTGAIELGGTTTSGAITIGNGDYTGNITIDTSASVLIDSATTDIRGTILELGSTSTGAIEIGDDAGRSDAITIGNIGNSGNTNLLTGALTCIRSVGGIDIGDLNTGAISIGNDATRTAVTSFGSATGTSNILFTTNGTIGVGNTPGRTGATYIGNDTAVGNILLRTGGGVNIQTASAGTATIGGTSSGAITIKSGSSVVVGDNSSASGVHLRTTGTVSINTATAGATTIGGATGGDVNVESNGDINVGVNAEVDTISLGSSSSTNPLLLEGHAMRVSTSTFTPTLTGSIGGDYTMSVQTGVLTSYGPLMHISVRIEYSVVTSGNVRVEGLPATTNPISNQTYRYDLGNVDAFTPANTEQTWCQATGTNLVEAKFYLNGTEVANTDMASIGTVEFSGWRFNDTTV